MLRATFFIFLLLAAGGLGFLGWGGITLGRDPSEVHLRRGTRLLEEGSFEEAEGDLRLALASGRPEILEIAHHNLAVAFLEMARDTDGLRAERWAEEAVSHAEAALRMDPGLESAGWNLELALRRLEEVNRGEASERARRARMLLGSFRLEEETRLQESLERTLGRSRGGGLTGKGGGPWW